jgi:hypothetical protein
MADLLRLYISAAADLLHERESLNRAVAEIPVTLGWRVIQTPLHGEPVNEAAISQADIYFLLLGSDIRAPAGYEWRLARRAHCHTAAFLKQDVSRTMAAQDFVRYLGEQIEWQAYQGIPALRQQTLKFLADHILSRSDYYALRVTEYEKLVDWRKTLETSKPEQLEYLGGIGESSILLSPERYIPSEGVLIQAHPQEDKSPRPPRKSK